MRRAGILTSLAALALALAVPSIALAGGIEYSGTGARGVARGGATMAKAEDANVLATNPAGLAEIQGSMFMADFQLAFMDACVNPYGFYGWGAYLGGKEVEFTDPDTGETERIKLDGLGDEQETDYFVDPLDTVCLDHNTLPVPQAAWVARLSDDLGMGFGMIFPAVTPGGRWGSTPYGTIRGESGELRPVPTRYMQLSAGSIGVFPTLGLGYRISDKIRVGAAFTWGVLSIHTRVMAAASSGTSPHNDLIAEVRGIDWFVPALTASVHLVPMDSLDVVLAFKAQDKVSTNGTLEVTSGVFDPSREVYTDRGIEIDKIEQGMPWKASAGVRYSQRLAPRSHSAGIRDDYIAQNEIIRDPMTDELWDIELDVEYQINSLVKESKLVPSPTSAWVNFEPPMEDGTPNGGAALDPQTIPKNWEDQWVVQVGGSYNILPGVVALHSGAHYETRGIDPAFMNIDFWPLSRFGLSAGFTIRMDRRLDFTVAYAHIFQETLTVRAPPHGDRAEDGFDKRVGTPQVRGDEGTLVEEETPADWDAFAGLRQQSTKTPNDMPNYTINSGVYTSSIDVLSVGLLYHF